MLNAATRQFEFTSEFDGLTVSAFIARPEGNINGIVQIVHGMNEHQERYFEFMDYLAAEGFITKDGAPLTSYMADVDTDAAFTPDTEAVADGYFHESEFRSAPYFDVQIDGIELLNSAF